MSAAELHGSPVAKVLQAEIQDQVSGLVADGIMPTLAVVVATDNEATHWYVRSIARAAEKVGISCRIIDLGPQASQAHIAATLIDLSVDKQTHGIILQTPLPAGVRADELVAHIDPDKDIDGANPLSLGRLAVGLPAFAPATARAVVELLEHHGIPLDGSHVTVVGRSAVVGKPLLHLLLDRNASVTICHSRSRPLEDYTRAAGIVVAAVGRPGLVTARHVAPGSVVVDVGTNVLEDGSLVGDVDAGSVADVASALSPVPGGVGTVTTALLLLHTTQAADQLRLLQRPPAPVPASQARA
ncbi:bifunctional 5,10-methylenetetrahydrofolate dehydrogenase/5,10-methenyltetrahydrofolate cyclohydrolase [Arthrobacter mobilis]|uniref:Bifunctional protein FolD n=1 Tax=Arthrobacter mobilis TaxID=2724944 RepID=A0A7X6K7Z3_9MICC|nr:bifunctional 5,10-methylenetetrahydrofolate dehydrogenase/5,10-methenyltetrahydrofolate cyclohydrolase [Arthrobacter mobilis]NKX56796.1 bifunctional 5,10-methylenetetrahydrofolate dehydrogenase/5,10-methenyltetrahydrofolate cyclohydrolase [Arthrobacter mobilis]